MTGSITEGARGLGRRLGSNAAASAPVAQISGDDVPGIVLAPESLRVREGRRATYTVALASQPAGTVTVTMTTDLAATDLMASRGGGGACALSRAAAIRTGTPNEGLIR